ncbi:MAG: hypothetical protein B7Y95_21715 [Rhizobiales bacterium 32-66-11]|nr:MAG: hypothetical protein B7Y95_21715 [Rhizobiales bacterium 32-66-11]
MLFLVEVQMTSLNDIFSAAFDGFTRMTRSDTAYATPDTAGSYAINGCYAVMKTAGTISADRLDAFEERAAIAEHDGGLPRAHAEVLSALETLDLGPNSVRIVATVARRLEFLARTGHLKPVKPECS